MNARLFVLSLCLSLTGISRAENGFLVGGGPNISTTNSGGDEYSPRWGWGGGFGYEHNLVGLLYVVPGAALETRGEIFRSPSDDSKATLKLLYLQVPLHLMVRIPIGEGAIEAFFGASIGYNIAASIERVDGNGDSHSEDIKDDVNFFECGLESGFGFEIPVGPGSLFVRPTLYRGLTHPLDFSPGTKLNNVQLKVGFRFPLLAPASAAAPYAPPPPPPPAFEP